MASESEASVSAFIERLMTMPLFASFSTTRPESYPDHDSDDPDLESSNRPSPDRIILINPLTQRMMVIGASDSLFNEFTKGGQPPASQAAIEGLPSVEIKCTDEIETLGGECVICLEELKVGDVVSEMPCKHKFHDGCVKKWLRIHGSCPVCRHKMPEDDKNLDRKIGDESGERREVWVTLAFGVGRSRSESENSNVESTIESLDS